MQHLLKCSLNVRSKVPLKCIDLNGNLVNNGNIIQSMCQMKTLEKIKVFGSYDIELDHQILQIISNLPDLSKIEFFGGDNMLKCVKSILPKIVQLANLNIEFHSTETTTITLDDFNAIDEVVDMRSGTRFNFFASKYGLNVSFI